MPRFRSLATEPESEGNKLLKRTGLHNQLAHRSHRGTIPTKKRLPDLYVELKA